MMLILAWSYDPTKIKNISDSIITRNSAIFTFGKKYMIWMKNDRIRVYVLGKKVEIDDIWNGESHK